MNDTVSSRRRWSLRVLAALAVWAVLTLAARVLGNQPRAALLALAVAAVATVVWLYLDASAQSDVPVWDRAADEPIRPPGEDARLALLTRVVAQHFDARRADGTLRRHLLELADHRAFDLREHLPGQGAGPSQAGRASLPRFRGAHSASIRSRSTSICSSLMRGYGSV